MLFVYVSLLDLMLKIDCNSKLGINTNTVKLGFLTVYKVGMANDFQIGIK